MNNCFFNSAPDGSSCSLNNNCKYPNCIEKMNKLVTITKIKDNVFNGKHPNGIYVGHTLKGIPEEYIPVLGHRYIVKGPKLTSRWLSTSLVIEIIDKNTFKTENSVYKLIYHK